VGQRTALPAKNTTLADLAVLSIYQRQQIDNLSLSKRVFCGVRKEKGARSSVGENVKKLDGTVISFATVPSHAFRI